MFCYYLNRFIIINNMLKVLTLPSFNLNHSMYLYLCHEEQYFISILEDIVKCINNDDENDYNSSTKDDFLLVLKKCPISN